MGIRTHWRIGAEWLKGKIGEEASVGKEAYLAHGRAQSVKDVVIMCRLLAETCDISSITGISTISMP